MLDVFRDSGFEVHSTTDAGSVEVRLSLQTSPASLDAADNRDRTRRSPLSRAILQPGAVAVIGASRNDSNLGRRVFEALLSSGFTGTLSGESSLSRVARPTLLCQRGAICPSVSTSRSSRFRANRPRRCRRCAAAGVKASS